MKRRVRPASWQACATREVAWELPSRPSNRCVKHTCRADVPALQDPHDTLAGPDDQRLSRFKSLTQRLNSTNCIRNAHAAPCQLGAFLPSALRIQSFSLSFM